MGSKKLWCVAIRPEGDSPYKQSPAASKEIAERAVARYKSMTLAEGNEFMIESFDDFIQVQQWHGTRKNMRTKCSIRKAGLKSRCTSAKTCSKPNKFLSMVKSCIATKIVLS